MFLRRISTSFGDKNCGNLFRFRFISDTGLRINQARKNGVQCPPPALFGQKYPFDPRFFGQNGNKRENFTTRFFQKFMKP